MTIVTGQVATASDVIVFIQDSVSVSDNIIFEDNSEDNATATVPALN